MPILPARRVQRTAGSVTSFDAGRGCPFQCSFCTIINVQGRKSRRRSPDDVEQIVRAQSRAGRQPLLHHRRQFRAQQGLGSDLRPPDRAAREGRHRHQLHHPGRHAVPQHPELHREGGARRRARACSSGWRTSIPTTCWRRKKRQNKITEYRKMLLAWKQVGVITYAGYILGFPERHAGIDPARHRDHQARAAGRSAGVLLPDAAAGLGGSPEAVPAKGVRDGSRPEQVRSRACPSPRIRRCREAEWERALSRAWETYYTPSTWRR